MRIGVVFRPIVRVDWVELCQGCQIRYAMRAISPVAVSVALAINSALIAWDYAMSFAEGYKFCNLLQTKQRKFRLPCIITIVS